MAGEKTSAAIAETPNSFSLKDSILILPILGTVLAATLDVGFFNGLDIAYFTMFSLAEHIVFALEALPIALLFASFLPFMMVAFKLGTDHSRSSVAKFHAQLETVEDAATRAHMIEQRIRRLALRNCLVDIGFAAIFFLLAFLSARNGDHFLSAFGTLGGLFFVTSALVLEYAHTRVFYIGSAIFAALVLSFTFGLTAGQRILALKAAKQTVAIVGADSDLRGNVVRSGERGVLFFDTDSRTIDFIPWSYIKGIRTPAAFSDTTRPK